MLNGGMCCLNAAISSVRDNSVLAWEGVCEVILAYSGCVASSLYYPPSSQVLWPGAAFRVNVAHPHWSTAVSDGQRD